jgi:carbon monoxide dehydrogenase subunit G
VSVAEYSTSTKLPIETIWNFVKEMDNWADLVTGYQSHEKQSDEDSTWVLKGDLGPMSRMLKLQVHIIEWNGPERVTFELTGINEIMEGHGTFEMSTYEEEDGPGADAAPAERKNFIRRLLEAIVRFFVRLLSGGAPVRAATADAGPGEGMAKLTFKLELKPGGPMAPMIDSMMKPVMLPAAEQLAGSIMARLEELQGAEN